MAYKSPVLTKNEMRVIKEATKILELYKDRLEYEEALAAFNKGLLSHGKVSVENVRAYGYRLDGIRMALDYFDWGKIVGFYSVKDKKIYAEAVRKYLINDMGKLYRFMTDPNVEIQYYDAVKDAKGKLKSVQVRLVERKTLLVEIQ